MAAFLVLRRLCPAVTAVLIGEICLTQWVFGVRAVGDTAVLIVLYTLGAYQRRIWIVLAAIATAELGVIMAVTQWGTPANQLLAGGIAAGAVTASSVVGIYLRLLCADSVSR